MGESLLISDDGYLLTLPDGSLCTDRDGAPCCCGGGGGCCIVPLPFPPERRCNKAPKCCCGNRVRVSIAKKGGYNFAAYAGGDFLEEKVDFLETVTLEVEVHKDENGERVWSIECIAFDFFREYSLWYNGVKYLSDPFTENSPAAGLGRWQQKIGPANDKPFAGCGPEPELLVSNERRVLYGRGPEGDENPYDGGFYAMVFGPRVFPNWQTVFAETPPCGGSHTDNDGDKLTWSSIASCKKLDITAAYESVSEDGGSVKHDQTFALVLTTLEDDCCPPDGPGVTPTFDSPTGVSPNAGASPLGDGGGYSFCRCGALVDGDFCGRCGAKVCVGCG